MTSHTGPAPSAPQCTAKPEPDVERVEYRISERHTHVRDVRGLRHIGDMGADIPPEVTGYGRARGQAAPEMVASLLFVWECCRSRTGSVHHPSVVPGTARDVPGESKP